MSTRVFVSSTHRDLEEYRAVVIDALLEADLHPIAMEYLGARSAVALEVCKQEVARCQILVGIYAWRYGFIPPGSEISITEAELKEAYLQGIPCYCFEIDKDQPWPSEHREEEAAGKLDRLKEWIRSRFVTATFTTPENLARLVVSAVLREKPEHITEQRRRELSLLHRVYRISGQILADITARPGEIRPDREEHSILGGALRESETVETKVVPLPPEWPLLDIFREHEDNLVLVGDPGSGKTKALHQLAQGLLGLAERNPQRPLPVVVKLLSWKAENTSFERWLIQEVHATYGDKAPFRVVEEWLKNDRLMPLLDGLDEVAHEVRPVCIRAINGFLGEHSTGIAVTCRSQVWKELASEARPNIAGEVHLRPLTPEQVRTYIEASEPHLEALRLELETNTGLCELATTPLMLDLMDGIYRDRPPGEPQLLQDVPRRELERQVIAKWVARMESKIGPRPFAKERIRSCLAWLGKQMTVHRIPRFEIERLQASWLARPAQVWGYAVLSRTLTGALLLVPVALPYGSFFPILFGSTAGLLVGTTEMTVPALGRSGRPNLQARLRQAAFRSAVFASLAFITFNLVGALWLSDLEPSQDWTEGLFFGLLAAVPFGVAFGSRPGLREEDATLLYQLKAGWSWKGAILGAAGCSLFTLLLWASYNLANQAWGYEPLGPAFGAGASIAAALLGILLGGILGRTRGDLVKLSSPNLGLCQAVKDTRKTAGWLGSCLAISVPAILGSAEWLNRSVGGAPQFTGLDLCYFAAAGAVGGIWIAAWRNGVGLLLHWILRCLLRRRLPLRWTSFLNQAADRSLLRREEGGYQFYHDKVREYFANFPEPAA